MGEAGPGIWAWKQGFWNLNCGKTEVGQIDRKQERGWVCGVLQSSECRGLLDHSVVAMECMPLAREPWGV